MKLYYSPAACSLASHIVLHEAGLAFTPVLVPTKTHKLEDGTDYYTLNAKGYVPMLEFDDGQRLTEGPAILQYIADQVPAKGLAPANGTMARYRVQEWLNFVSTEVHKSFSPLFIPTAPEECKPFFKQRIAMRLKWVDEQLAGTVYLVGDAFTVADAYLFVCTSWCAYVGIDISELKNLGAYMARISARPAVQAAMKAEGLAK